MTAAAASALKLAAEDAADLEVISAALQDAVVKVADLAFDPKSWRFAALLNRYRWEAAPPLDAPGERVRSMLQFEHVLSVRSLRLRRDARAAVASILAVRFEPEGEPPGGKVRVLLAGGGELELVVEALQATLTDLGPPWRARSRPDHGINEPEAEG